MTIELGAAGPGQPAVVEPAGLSQLTLMRDLVDPYHH
jgi:hypothetical protein